MRIDLGPRYECLRELGSGATARLLLARDLHLGKEVALKLFHEAPASAEELEQAQREFALLAELEHPRIARAHDFGYLEGRPYFTSELVPGEPLSRSDEPRPETELVALAADLAEALAFLHDRGILHLDVKPSNVIVSPGPGRPRAVLVDFGLFRRGPVSPAGPRVRGSLPYMAPEYFRNEAIGPWTDVYALGVTLYRAATGTFPRAGANDPSGRLDDPRSWEPAPRPPHETGRGCPEDLSRVILRCLALDPAARFSSGRELLDTLRRLRGLPAAAADATGAAAGMVGRGRELAIASDFVRDLSERIDSPRVLLVTGPAGSGQSSFLRAVKVQAQTAGIDAYLEVAYPGRPGVPGAILRGLGAHLRDPADRERWDTFLRSLSRPRGRVSGQLTEGERRLRRAGEVAFAARGISGPLVLAVDGLHLADEVSIELFSALVRVLGEEDPTRRPSLGLIAAYREEGASERPLRELTEHLLRPGAARTIALGPLGIGETLELYRALGGRALGGLAVWQRSGGLPRAILELARSEGAPGGSARAPEGGPAPGRPSGAPRRGPGAGPGAAADLVLRTLALLGRPAREEELARCAGVPRRAAAAAVEALERAGLVSSPEQDLGPREWLATAGRPPSAGRRGVRALHVRIARSLERDAARSDEARLREAVRHYAAAGRSRDVVRLGPRAAERLEETLQHRAALEVYRLVLRASPPGRHPLRLEIALKMADLHSRIGGAGVEEGIRILRELIPRARRMPAPARERILLRLATLHSRRGDFRRAEALFAEGLRRAAGDEEAAPARGALGREELLLFTNEHAAMKAATGRCSEAAELCERGLRLAGRSRRPEIREIVLNLHATRANIATRTFRFEDAVRDFQRALEIAETIGSPANQATLLNNLGVVLSQSDRYDEALAAWTEAEKLCLQLDEGPSLASIHGNVAVLHAKLGGFGAMEEALEKGRRLVPAVIGRRQEYFLAHVRGLCRMAEGRYSEAREALERAIELGEAIGDRHLVSFDRVFRAECLGFDGSYEAARAELDLAAASGPERIRGMALARRAWLRSALGDVRGVLEDAAARLALSASPPVPFLDAWDRAFVAWALSAAGDRERVAGLLVPAREFFLERGLRPAGALATWILAEHRYLSGEMDEATGLLAALRVDAAERLRSHGPGGGSRLTDVLVPLLEARLALDGLDLGRAADLLAEAGASLVGNPLPEAALRLEALRALLRGLPDSALSEIEARRAGRSPDAGAASREPDPSWKAWTRRPPGLPARSGEGGGDRPPGPPRPDALAVPAGVEDGSSRTAALHAGRGRLVAKSPRMRRLVALLDRLRSNELPVLIRGETGTGKELVARVIHEESRRARGPFRVVDCATLPEGLLESELFGARAGAFTDLREDRAGILAQAAGGTVLVDEIGGASAHAQARLLRVLSSGRARPVGAEEEVPIDARFLFSTSLDLEAEVRAGRFRSDLYHRIRVLVVEVPSLRDRPEDFEDLVRGILGETGAPSPVVERAAIEKLRGLDWPGNVRELANVLARARVEMPDAITVEGLARCMERGTTILFPRNLLASGRLPALKDRLERDYIVYHYRRLGQDTRALMAFLGLSRRNLYRRCSKLGIRLRRREPR